MKRMIKALSQSSAIRGQNGQRTKLPKDSGYVKTADKRDDGNHRVDTPGTIQTTVFCRKHSEAALRSDRTWLYSNRTFQTGA
jgi:hypothetical protein